MRTAQGQVNQAPSFALPPETPGVVGARWTPRETVRNWVSIASSSDGSRLAAVESSGKVFISADYGETRRSSSSQEPSWPGAAAPDPLP